MNIHRLEGPIGPPASVPASVDAQDHAALTLPPPRIGVLYENPAWVEDLFLELAAAGLAFTPIDVTQARFDLEELPPHALYFNRVSPSSHSRGHGAAVPFIRSLMTALEAQHLRVMNGVRSFQLETSKVAQHVLLKSLGVQVPATQVFNSEAGLREAAADLDYPRILKPNMGGSGANVHRVESAEHLIRLIESDEDLLGPDHLVLSQALLPEGRIVRTEFIDGDLVYAMRVHARNTFNLCPADLCVRNPVREEAGPAQVEFEPYLDIPADAVAQSREIVRAAGLDVGGVEFLETPRGERIYFDINATSVYRMDVSEAWSVESNRMLVQFLGRELHKEAAKLAVRSSIGVWKHIG